MSIAIVCKTCGKNLKVPDDRAGKLAKCPGCLTAFTVPMAGGAAAVAPMAVPAGMPLRKPERDVPKVAIAWGTLFMIIGLIAIPATVAAIYFGPVRTKHQWDAMYDQARSDVEDVVVRAMQSDASHSPFYDPKKTRVNAGVRDLMFMSPFSFRMPEFVEFKGMSTQGEFKGKYFTKTGEVVASVDTGGMTFEGLDKAIAKGTKTLQVTGRKKNDQLSVEIGGKNADIVTAKPTAADSE